MSDIKGQSIGLLELKSIPIGIQTADEMLKAADVKLLLAAPMCPGKYMIIVTGNVGSVKSSVAVGVEVADMFLIGEYIINNVHESVPGAILGNSDIKDIKSLGVIETISAMTAVMAGDIAAKASNIQLIEIRIARGLGGKGFVIFTGEISSVKTAINSCLNQLKDTGEIISHCTIASPHKDLINNII